MPQPDPQRGTKMLSPHAGTANCHSRRNVVLRGVMADPDRLGEVREAAAELPVDMSHG